MEFMSSRVVIRSEEKQIGGQKVIVFTLYLDGNFIGEFPSGEYANQKAGEVIESLVKMMHAKPDVPFVSCDLDSFIHQEEPVINSNIMLFRLSDIWLVLFDDGADKLAYAYDDIEHMNDKVIELKPQGFIP